MIQFLLDFITGIRWDIFITTILSIICYLILLIKRGYKNKSSKNKKDILVWFDFIFAMVTSATLYGGISAIYYSMKGKLLFNQNFIISQEYMVLFSGFVLIALAILTYQKALHDIEGNKK